MLGLRLSWLLAFLGLALVALPTSWSAAPREASGGEPEAITSAGMEQLKAGNSFVARKALAKAVELWRERVKVQPEDYDHRQLVLALNHLGVAQERDFDQTAANQSFHEAATLARKLPAEDAEKPAIALNNLGHGLHMQGDYQRALPFLQEALARERKLLATNHERKDLNRLAVVLTNVGLLQRAMGESEQALAPLHEALKLRERLATQTGKIDDKLKQAVAINNLALIHEGRGEHADALKQLERGLAIMEALYPPEKFKAGHPELARALLNHGTALLNSAEAEQAVEALTRAEVIHRKLYENDRFPRGHPELARALSALAVALRERGILDRAEALHREALKMRETLYPKGEYPLGHPDLAVSLHQYGVALAARGATRKALPVLQKAVAMNHGLAQRFAEAGSEAEALNYLSRLPLARDAYLTLVPADPDLSADAVYATIWPGRSAVARVLDRRREVFASGKGKELGEELQSIRRQLARAALSPALGSVGQRQKLTQMNQRKEQLERDLASLASMEKSSAEAATPSDLARLLPRDAAFIDFVRYQRIEQDPKKPGAAGRKASPRYLAFVVLPKQRVQSIDLGPADAIDRAVLYWRQALRNDQTHPEVTVLREQLWAPLACCLPEAVKTIYLAPEGQLTRLPWAALPHKDGRVLLEDYALALVPHGAFLHDRLAKDATGQAEQFLALGGVNYGQAGPPIASLAPELRDVLGGANLWRDLPGTARELDQLIDLAKTRKCKTLRDSDASTANLLAALPEARWAHLATHGFYAHGLLRSVLQLDEKAFGWPLRERAQVGARNPLLLSGLVLANANVSRRDDPLLDDHGIVTAEAIAGLRLDNLRLVTLSACESGLGELSDGEGVFGLGRAFHQAGTHNVVGSLWKVNDLRTAALMTSFYHKLWHENKTPLVALREAQLALYHHPDYARVLSFTRDPDFANVVALPPGALDPRAPAAKGKGAVRDWAGFMLSGTGQ